MFRSQYTILVTKRIKGNSKLMGNTAEIMDWSDKGLSNLEKNGPIPR